MKHQGQKYVGTASRRWNGDVSLNLKNRVRTCEILFTGPSTQEWLVIKLWQMLKLWEILDNLYCGLASNDRFWTELFHLFEEQRRQARQPSRYSEQASGWKIRAFFTSRVKRFFSSSKRPERVRDPARPLFRKYQGSFPEIKRPGREVDLPLTSIY